MTWRPANSCRDGTSVHVKEEGMSNLKECHIGSVRGKEQTSCQSRLFPSPKIMLTCHSIIDYKKKALSIQGEALQWLCKPFWQNDELSQPQSTYGTGVALLYCMIYALSVGQKESCFPHGGHRNATGCNASCRALSKAVVVLAYGNLTVQGF
eukprot:scaffold22871_cov17-Tisochrysis_lutea.AAC.1